MNPESGKLFSRVSTNYEDEYIRSIHSKYSITISPKSDDRFHTENFTKMRNGKLGDASRLSSEVNNGVSISLTQRKKMDLNSQSATYLNALNLSKKRKLQETEHQDSKSQRKKRKIESIAERLRTQTEPETEDDVNTEGHVKNEVKLKRNSNGGLARKKDVEQDKIDKNCNLLRDQIKTNKDGSMNQIHNKDNYTNPLKDLSDSSPFKGKMSAFEISRLKGKQSVERRKSLEAATLRTSPRLNTNVAANQHTEKRSARSLTPSLNEKSLVRRAAKTARMEKKERKRMKERSKSLGAVSPSSIENQLVTTKLKKPSVSKRRSLRSQDKQTENDVKKCSSRVRRQSSLRSSIGSGKSPSTPMSSFTRLNGSPKLKTSPEVLSISSLSGISQSVQGSVFSTVSQRKHGISGTPPSLPSMNSAALDEEVGPPYVHSVSRPSSLPVGNSGKHDGADINTETAPMQVDSCEVKRNDKLICKSLMTKQGRNLLEEKETETGNKWSNLDLNCVTRSPLAGPVLSGSTADGRRSRRSSRSSTPNVSPIKPDVLTPRCTPCSTPNKSPPDLKQKKYLFGRLDDVIARWHDGLFYIGKILKIDDTNAKCLLRYEDNSQYWSLFKDIHRMVTEEEICCICLGETSEPPNEIVICDHCNQGYHQKCHAPYIDPHHVVDPDDEWYCRQCVFFLTVKIGGAVKEGSRADDLRKMKQVLPYDLTSLTWDSQHKNNVEQKYCYCGGPGIWYEKMLQCCRCKQWFHEACLQCIDYPLLFGDSFFIYVCSRCNSGQEYMKRLVIEWADVTHIVMFNLALDKRRKYFDVAEEILPWVEENWNLLRIVDNDSQQQEFDSSEVTDQVMKVLQENKTRFCNAGEIRKKHSLWGLRIRVPPPRIQVDLPVSIMLTNDIMKRLKIKGRRSKVFIPVECKSPVKHICESPSRSRVANRNFGNHLGTKNDGTYDEVIHKDLPTFKLLKNSRKKLPLLDKLIPVDTIITSHSHPFKSEIEQELEHDLHTLRKKIWDSYCQSSQTGDNLSESLEVPPVLEKVEPVFPAASNNESPPMPVIQDKKKRKLAAAMPIVEELNGVEEDEAGDNNKAGCRRSSRKLSNPSTIPVLRTEIDVKKVKSAEGNYFCAYDKLGFGQGFHISGRRVNHCGKVECFINWDY